jgi:hypothetical protein
MRKILLPLIFILSSALQLHAIVVPTPYVNQTKYRWRNNDGNEATATWRAAENTAISLSDTITVLRGRIELQNNSGATHTINEYLEYSSNSGATWTSMTNSATDAFRYVTTANVTNGASTTNQMGSSTVGVFQAGKIISDIPSGTNLTIVTGNKTEYEWVIKPTGSLLPMSTYIFRSSSQGSTPVIYATINTGCVNVSVASKTDSARCGPGTLNLKATGSTGTTMKWYDVPTGGTALGTGPNFTTPSLTASKVYYVAASMGTTCESPRMAVNAVINPLPVVNLGSDVTVCLGDPATFTAGNFSAYLWDNGATTQTRTVNTAGTYYVTVTGAGNCKGIDTIKLLNHPKPIVDLGNDTSICPGSSLTLNAGNPGMTYQWDNGTTGQTRTVNTAGTYSVKVTNQFGCNNTDLISLIIKDLPLGNISAIHGNPATYTFKVLEPQYTVGYLWNFGDGTPEVSSMMTQHTYATNGIYNVKLVLVGDCDSNATKFRTVDVFDAGTTSIDNVEGAQDVVLYPNPARKSVTISNKSALQFRTIEVFNILGQKMISVKGITASSISLETDNLATGMYSLRIETDKGFIVRKFEVRK